MAPLRESRQRVSAIRSAGPSNESASGARRSLSPLLRRAMLAAALLPLMQFGTCGDLAVRVAINSVIDATTPLLLPLAEDAGQRAGVAVDSGGP